MATSAVNKAMSKNRVPKKLIRKSWTKIIKEENANQNDTSTRLLYLTLPGEEGKDIERLIEAGIIRLSENNKTIHEEDASKIIAIEANHRAYTNLRRKFPGLEVKHNTVKNLIAGDSALRFPEGKNKYLWKARIINLDLDCPFKGEDSAHNPEFETIKILKKISDIQYDCQHRDWYLFLTLNANLCMTDTCWTEVKSVLNENFKKSSSFFEACRQLISIITEEGIGCQQVEDIKSSSDFQQLLLMALLPKLFIQTVRRHRWVCNVEKCFAYGNTDNGEAKMVSWIIRLERPQQDCTEEQCYNSNVDAILNNIEFLSTEGPAANE